MLDQNSQPSGPAHAAREDPEHVHEPAVQDRRHDAADDGAADGQRGAGKRVFWKVDFWFHQFSISLVVHSSVSMDWVWLKVEAECDSSSCVNRSVATSVRTLIKRSLYYCVPFQVQNLSGGELQRVALVLCLGKSASVYLIDEPSAYLDSEQRLHAAKVIKR